MCVFSWGWGGGGGKLVEGAVIYALLPSGSNFFPFLNPFSEENFFVCAGTQTESYKIKMAKNVSISAHA